MLNTSHLKTTSKPKIYMIFKQDIVTALQFHKLAPNFLTLSPGQQAILIVDSCLLHANIFFPRGAQNKEY